MKEYFLYYKYLDGEISKSPLPIPASDLRSAENQGRELLEMAGGINIPQSPSNLGFLPLQTAMTAIVNSMAELPVFDHAELTPKYARLAKTGMCQHNVRAKYCRACKN